MNRDLIHFLRLGLMRVRHRAAELAIELRVTGAAGATDAPGRPAGHRQELETLKILEDLILEQVPYENIDHSAR